MHLLARPTCGVYALLWLALAGVSYGKARPDPRLDGAFRKNESGWIYLHLQGTPSALGFQHGSLLAAEIEDSKKAIELSTTHGVKHSWAEMRAVSDRLFVPKLTAEYRQELTGIVDGLHDHGSKLDFLDLVTMNAYMEFTYYYDAAKHLETKGVPVSHAPDHCSAFIATGSYTKDGRIVIGHNNWTDYLTGTRWNMIFDIAPSSGHHFIMDGMPGLIHSGDDFGINDSGIMITETTIGSFFGFRQSGTPEFIRARRAMQYSESVEDFARIMKEDNNGGYANTWLVGDRKVNKIARLELGLKNVTLDQSSDGYFVGSNFPINPKLIKEETTFPANDPNTPNEVRHRRWNQLMAENKGQIDVELGKKFETDHYDLLTKEIDPNERTICGHIDKSSRGLKDWQDPYGPAGVAEVKVADAAMAERLSFAAGMGHPCGVAFHAADFLKAHKEYAWQSGVLQDVGVNPWIVVEATRPGVNAAPAQ